MGTIVAHDRKALSRWRQSTTRRETRTQRGLTGAALEAAVMQVAAMFPENVVTA